MKPYAIAFTARERAELAPVDEPPDLGPTQVRGRTLYTLVSPGTGLEHGYLGERFPVYPGYAAVFRADEIGEAVRDTRVGDLLFCMGGHRSLQQMDVSETAPDGSWDA